MPSPTSVAPTPVSDGLSRYLRTIRRAPWLDPVEERELAWRWLRDGDRAAADRLITTHLRMVVTVAMRFRGYGLPLADLIAEGNIGLMDAVRKFDPERGFRLSTFAIWCIRAACGAYVLRSWSLVKIGTTAQQKKLFFGLRRAKAQISALNDGELHPDQVQAIAEALGVRPVEVLEMDRRLRGDARLNAPKGPEDTTEWQDMLVDDSVSVEASLAETEDRAARRRALAAALGTLNPRERHIIQVRRLTETPKTLEALAAEYGVTRERIRQIEVRAVEKLHAVMTGTPRPKKGSPGLRLRAPNRSRSPSSSSEPAELAAAA